MCGGSIRCMAWSRASDEPKLSKVECAARDAHAAGELVFVAQLAEHVASDSRGLDWGATISSVESMGWSLEHWAVAQPAGDRSPVRAYPLFRRVGVQVDG